MITASAEISEAETGEDALQQVARDRPDLVGLDLEPPGIRGLTMLRNLLARHDLLAVLVLSMYTEIPYAEGAMRLGARGYLSKNPLSEELLAALHRVVDGHRYIGNEFARAIALKKDTPNRDW